MGTWGGLVARLPHVALNWRGSLPDIKWNSASLQVELCLDTLSLAQILGFTWPSNRIQFPSRNSWISSKHQIGKIGQIIVNSTNPSFETNWSFQNLLIHLPWIHSSLEFPCPSHFRWRRCRPETFTGTSGHHWGTSTDLSRLSTAGWGDSSRNVS